MQRVILNQCRQFAFRRPSSLLRVSRIGSPPNCSHVRPSYGAFAPKRTLSSTKIPHDRPYVEEIPFEDTIFALSTASGRAAIAIIRVSGQSCVEIYQALCPNKSLPQPRYAAVRTLYDPSQPTSKDAILDSNSLVLYFPSPKTVTGEDILELHVHGGPAIVKAVLQAIPRCTGTKSTIRYAEPGEFTHRAFMNDRLDLTQVEALGDVLSAVTEQQRKLSVRGTSGKLAKQYETWRTQLLYARGELEALIDFSEDQHFDESPAVLASSVASQVQDLRIYLEAHITNAMRGELLRNGIGIALLGAPNAGKSSLLNRIVGRDAAIVSREAGTTRDVVEVGIDLGGYLCRFGDMAGLRANQASGDQPDLIGVVEEEGIRRAKQQALESEVVIVVAQVERYESGEVNLRIDPEVVKTAEKCAAQGSKILAIINKVDLLDRLDADVRGKTSILMRNILEWTIPSLSASSIFETSCTTLEHTGVKNFLSGLISTFENMTSATSPDEGWPDQSSWQESLGASERHRLLLQDSLLHLDNFLAQVAIDENLAEEDLDIVVAAESLRAAADCLAKITGRGGGDVEEVLGVVFEKFCVGK